MRGITRETQLLVVDALSYMCAKTVQDVCQETALDEKVVHRVLRHMVANNQLEKRGRKYRYFNEIPWR